MNTNKALIFGLGGQGKKYLDFFYEQKIQATGVRRRNKKFHHTALDRVYTYDKYMGGCLDISLYDMIIVAVSPLKEQERVLNSLLKMQFAGKLVIEKSVAQDIRLLQKLTDHIQCYFFVDECILTPYYAKIFPQTSIKVSVPNDLGMLEHALSPFLLREDFSQIVKDVELEYLEEQNKRDLVYRLSYGNREVLCHRGNFSLSGHQFFSMNFSQSLEFTLSLSEKQNSCMKENYLVLKKYLSSLTKIGSV